MEGASRPAYTTVTQWGKVRIVRCPHCHLAQLDDFPSLEKADDLYEGNSIYVPPDLSRWDALVSSFRHVATDLRKLSIFEGRVLEVGCNAGYALKRS